VAAGEFQQFGFVAECGVEDESVLEFLALGRVEGAAIHDLRFLLVLIAN
jgi:hypothetical protein